MGLWVHSLETKLLGRLRQKGYQVPGQSRLHVVSRKKEGKEKEGEKKEEEEERGGEGRGGE